MPFQYDPLSPLGISNKPRYRNVFGFPAMSVPQINVWTIMSLTDAPPNTEIDVMTTFQGAAAPIVGVRSTDITGAISGSLARAGTPIRVRTDVNGQVALRAPNLNVTFYVLGYKR